MSRWMLVLAGLFCLTLPLSAQTYSRRTAVETAPMPRAKHGTISLGFGVSSTGGLQLHVAGEEWVEGPNGEAVGKHPINAIEAVERLGTLMRPVLKEPPQLLVQGRTLPLQPWERTRDRYTTTFDNGLRPMVPPIRAGQPMPICDQPPSDVEVLKALPPMAQGVPQVFETFRDDVTIVKERVTDRIHEPRFYPLVGIAQHHNCSWKCSVYFTEVVQTSYPFPTSTCKPRVEVVYIDKDYLHLVASECRDGEKCQANKVKPSPYLIEAPDNLLIKVGLKTKAGVEPLPVQPVAGAFLVRPDGTVGLGKWGSVSVSGCTLDKAADALTAHFKKQGVTDIVVSVDVLAYNSKRYYVITDSSGPGEQIHAMPHSGTETVLDAMANVGGLPSARCEIWIARPTSNAGQPAQILPVDWAAITQLGVTKTNHQLLPGDRIYVKANKAKTTVMNSNVETTMAVTVLGESKKLSGTYYREMPGCVTACTFKNGELTVSMTCAEGDKKATITLTAEYSVAKDGTVFGIFTGADANTTDDSPEMMESMLTLQGLVDQPFAARCRLIDGGLMLSSVRLAGTGEDTRASLGRICGKYKWTSDGKMPAPKAKPAGVTTIDGLGFGLSSTSSSDPRLCPTPNGPSPGLAVPPPPYPIPAGSPTTVCPAPVPNGPPAEMQLLMMQAFNQMLYNPAGPPPHLCVPPAPARPVQPATYAAAPMTAPTLPSMVAPNANPLPTGTWRRELGPVQYKLEMKGDHLTITVTTTEIEDDKRITVDHILMVDCFATNNGNEVVGLVAGFDMSASKTLDLEDAQELMRMLPEIQKELSKKPVAFSLRKFDDCLVISDVRLPNNRREDDEVMEMFKAMAGRYRMNGEIPALESVPAKRKKKLGEELGGFTLPDPRYLQHQPQYFPSDPVFPMPRELATPTQPPLQRIGVDFITNPPMFTKPTTVPPMPRPEPMPSSEPGRQKTNPFRNGGVTAMPFRSGEYDFVIPGEPWPVPGPRSYPERR